MGGLQQLQMPATRGDLRRLAVVDTADQGRAAAAQAVQDKFDDVFRKICANCSAWRASIPSAEMADATKAAWLEVFLANAKRLSPEAIKFGLQALQAKRQKYLPSPQEFVDLCSGAAFPSLEDCKYEIQAGRKPFSSAFVAYLASRCGGILHPSTSKEAMATGFALEYRAALRLAESGYFDNPVPMIEKKEADPNLVFYKTLLGAFPQAADDFLHDLERRGIVLSV